MSEPREQPSQVNHREAFRLRVVFSPKATGTPSRIWSNRSEVVERLLAQECELCGSTDKIEVHHIRKLADVAQKGKSERPDWMKKMAARHRKTLVVCLECHHKIQYGRYDGKALSRRDYWKAT